MADEQDIVGQLRDYHTTSRLRNIHPRVCDEGADEIERLRTERTTLLNRLIADMGMEKQAGGPAAALADAWVKKLEALRDGGRGNEDERTDRRLWG